MGVCTLLLAAASVVGPLTAVADLEFAHGLYRRGEYALAAKEYQAVLAGTPTPTVRLQAHFYLGESLVQAGETDAALKEYRAVVRDQAPAGPTPADYRRIALLRLGKLYERQGADPLAEQYLREFLSAYPDDQGAADAAWTLARTRLRQGNAAGALEALDQAEAAEPPEELERRIRMTRSRALVASDRPDEARTLLRGLAAEPRQALADLALIEWALLELDADRTDQAADLLDRFAQQHPDSRYAAEASLYRGRLLRRQGQSAQALAALKPLTEGADGLPAALRADAFYQTGLAQAATDDFAGAERSFATAARDFPDSDVAPAAAVEAANAQLRNGVPGKAAESLDRLLPTLRDPSLQRRGHYVRGLVADANGDMPRLREARQWLVRNAPAAEETAALTSLLAERIVTDDPAQRTAALAELAADTPSGPARDAVDYLRAVAAFDDGDFAGAADLLATLAAGNPADALAAKTDYLLGVAAAKADRWSAARTALARYLQRDLPTHEPIAFRLLAESLTKGLPADGRTPEQWLEVVRDAAKDRDDRGTVLREVGRTLAAGGQPDLADGIYRQILDDSSMKAAHPAVLVDLGWNAYRGKRADAAAESFGRAVQTTTADTDPAVAAEALYMAGVTAAETSHPADARSSFERLLKEQPQSSYTADAGLRLADTLSDAGDFAAAERILDQAVVGAGSPDAQARVRYERAWLAQKRGDDAAALDLFAAVGTEFPDHELAAASLTKAAELALRAGADQRAFDLASAATTKPGAHPPELWFNRGLAALGIDRPDDARESFQRVMQEAPRSEQAARSRFRLGEIAFDAGDYQTALRRFEEVAEDPVAASLKPRALVRMAQSYLEQDELDRAIRLAKQAAAATQDFTLGGEAHYVHGAALSRQAEYDRAREQFEKVLGPRRTETAAKAQFMIAESHFHQQDYEEAVRAFRKVEVLYPFPRWQALALLEAGKCQERLAQPERAADLYHDLLERFPDTEAAGPARQRLAEMNP